jgi:hypothetical protein
MACTYGLLVGALTRAVRFARIMESYNLRQR